VRFLLILLLFLGAGSLFSGTMPLTVKEVALMLRSGYSNEAVMKDIAQRHFADTLDANAEKQLSQAGANPALLEALRDGSYRASAEEIAARQKKTAAEEDRTAEAEATPTRRTNETASTSQRPSPATTSDAVYQLLKGDLVCWHQDSVVPFDDEALQKKAFYLFFFSANWSPPARKFTSQLIDYYNRTTAQHPELEVIFFSADRSQFGMETYLGQSRMPWPAVAFPQIGNKAAAMNVGMVRDLPCLILADAAGRVISNTGGKSNRTPEQVLADADKVLAYDAGLARAR
jgi:hypothetical protein